MGLLRPPRAVLGSFFLAVVFASSPSAFSEDEPEKIDPVASLQQGIFAVARKEFAQAEPHFRKVVSADPHQSMALYYLAVCRSQAADPEAALEYAVRAVESGFEGWQGLARDPYLKESRQDEGFRKGLDALLSRFERRAKGDVDGLTFDFDLTAPDGTPVRASDFRGQVLAVCFVDLEDLTSLEAVSYLEALSDAGTVPLQVVVLARVTAKKAEERARLVREYSERNVLTFPVLLAPNESRSRLRPFRAFPTVLFLDARGAPRRIVEGVPTKDAFRVYEKRAVETSQAPPLAKPDSKPEAPPKRS